MPFSYMTTLRTRTEGSQICFSKSDEVSCALPLRKHFSARIITLGLHARFEWSDRLYMTTLRTRTGGFPICFSKSDDVRYVRSPKKHSSARIIPLGLHAQFEWSDRLYMTTLRTRTGGFPICFSKSDEVRYARSPRKHSSARIKDMQERYFSDCNDDITAFEHVNYALAVLKP